MRSCGAALQYCSGFVGQLELMEQPKIAWPGFPLGLWSIIRNHTDPADVLKPEVYTIGDAVWFKFEKAAEVARLWS